jgi:hypothetical protein
MRVLRRVRRVCLMFVRDGDVRTLRFHDLMINFQQLLEGFVVLVMATGAAAFPCNFLEY